MIFSKKYLPQNYYVYAYLRTSDLTPYYIGKGIKSRAWVAHNNVLTPKQNTQIVIVEDNLTNIGACAIERRLIKWYGRKDLGTGILRNKTDGGEGTTGMSDKTKKLISKRLTGKSKSEKHKKNLRLSKKLAAHPAWNKGTVGGARATRCIFVSPDGSKYEYASLRQGCKENNLSLKLMSWVVKNLRSDNNGWLAYKVNT